LIFKTEGTAYIFDAPCTLFCQMAAAVKQSAWCIKDDAPCTLFCQMAAAVKWESFF